jgi:hypothetical protein
MICDFRAEGLATHRTEDLSNQGHVSRLGCLIWATAAHTRMATEEEKSALARNVGSREREGLTDLSSVGHCARRTQVSRLAQVRGESLNGVSGGGGKEEARAGGCGGGRDTPRIFFNCMMVELARMRWTVCAGRASAASSNTSL